MNEHFKKFHDSIQNAQDSVAEMESLTQKMQNSQFDSVEDSNVENSTLEQNMSIEESMVINKQDAITEINSFCQRLTEYIDDEKSIDKLNTLLKENPKILDALQESIEDIQVEKDLLKEFETLKKYDLPQEKISQKAFENFIDDVFSGDKTIYQKTPNIVYLGDLNSKLSNILKLNTAKIYFLRKNLLHNRPQRKSEYGQDLPIEIFKNMPTIIETAQNIYIDKIHSNFFIANLLDDGLAIFSFNKDKDGNFVVHTKKVRDDFIKNKNIIKVSPTGVAPVISRLSPLTRIEDSIAATSLQASSDTSSEIIPQDSLNQAEIEEQGERLSDSSKSNQITHKGWKL